MPSRLLRQIACITFLLTTVVQPGQSTASSPRQPVSTPSASATDSPIVTAPDDQMAPAIAYDSHTNQYLVVWEDHRAGLGAQWGIYGRLIKADGVPAGAEFVIALPSANHHMAPAVAHNSARNEFIVVWEYEYTSTDHDIYAQRLDSTGALIGAQIVVSAFRPYFESNPVVVYNTTSGEYMVFWEGCHADYLTSESFTLFARRIDGTGALVGNLISLAPSNNARQRYPDAAYIPTRNQYLVVQQESVNGADWNIRAQFIITNGTPTSNPFDVTSRADDQVLPRVAYNSGADQLLVIWEDHYAGEGSEWAISGQRLSASGTLAGGLFDLTTDTGNRHVDPNLAHNPTAGKYMAVWGHTGEIHVVFWRRVGTTGALLGDETPVTAQPSWEAHPAISAGANSLYLTTWEDSRNLFTSNGDIYGEIIPPPPDMQSPIIISGPFVISITQNSAAIMWITNESSDTLVRYGARAREFATQQYDGTAALTHSLTLTNLAAATLYHFVVASADQAGNTVTSRDLTFNTIPAPDSQDPVVTINAPAVITRTAVVSATASDNAGISMVQFYVGGQLRHTDYTAPFQMPLNSSLYPSGTYQLQVKAFDTSNRWRTDTISTKLWFTYDIFSPTVTILSPADGVTVGGVISVTARILDDGQIEAAYLQIDGQWAQAMLATAGQMTRTIVLDTTRLPNGIHALTVLAYDNAGHKGSATVTVTVFNPPPPPVPSLVVKQHAVQRIQNRFYITLTVQNVGNAWAMNIKIRDYLAAFQPISKAGLCPYVETYVAQFDTTTHTTNEMIDDCRLLPPGQSFTYSYMAIPYMYYSGNPATPKPAVGSRLDLAYDGPNGASFSQQIQSPVMMDRDGDPLLLSHAEAIRSSKYLLVTNPGKMFIWWLDKDPSEINGLLSDMARLADVRGGVIGYLDDGLTYGGRYALRELLSPFPVAGLALSFLSQFVPEVTDNWALRMHPDFIKPTGGYLLIVGEVEIVSSWTTLGWNLLSSIPNHIPFSDILYADITGDGAPEINVGRAIGDTPQEIAAVLHNSFMEYGMDRSSALVVSGTGNGEGAMVVSANSIANELWSDGFSVNTLHLSGVTTTQQLAAISDHITNKDVVLLFAHGSPDGIGPIAEWDVPQFTLGPVNPLVYAPSCLTGDYVNGNLAEAFLQQGAAVYIGSTQISELWHNADSVKQFFQRWSASKTIGKAFTELKRDYWATADIWWRFLASEYNLYGDPAYGMLPASGLPIRSAAIPAMPVNALAVHVPTYTVNTVNGLDYTAIPTGSVILEAGMPQVPYYTLSLDYPQGYRVQDVTIASRTGLTTASGLQLPTTTRVLASEAETGLSTPVVASDWFPRKDFDWHVLVNADGSQTLVVSLYPFFYNAQTTDVKFYQDYTLQISATLSSVAISSATTDRDVYLPGDHVAIDVGINNTGAAQDVVVDAAIMKLGVDELASGLPLHTLTGLSGEASYSMQWDSTTFASGDYVTEVVLRNTSGQELDRRSAPFHIGVTAGQIERFTVTPALVDAGAPISVSLIFSNTGSDPITGKAVMALDGQDGALLRAYTETITSLVAGASTRVNAFWQTPAKSGAIYTATGYVLFDSGASEMVTATVRTRPRIYLPLIRRNR